MIKLIKNKLINYYHELNSIDLLEFNNFIFRKLILSTFKTDNILPFMVGISILTISISIQRSIFIFIPQGSIASFASFILLVVAIAIATILIYPLIIIFSVNYLGHKIRGVLQHMFPWIKLSFIVAAFYTCITLISPSWKDLEYRVYMTGVWFLLYFILANLYLAHKSQDSMFKLSKSRLLLFVLFLIAVFPQFVSIFIRTSSMINYTTVNPKLYLTSPSCQLLSRNPSNFESGNLTINDSEYFKQTADGGCFLYSNSIRYGFASDYTIIFQRNLKAVAGRDNKLYNQYVRLSCYSGNCYASDSINVEKSIDVYGDMIRNSREHRTALDPHNN